VFLGSAGPPAALPIATDTGTCPSLVTVAVRTAMASTSTRTGGHELAHSAQSRRPPRCELVARWSVTVADAGQRSTGNSNGRLRAAWLLHLLLHPPAWPNPGCRSRAPWSRVSAVDVRQMMVDLMGLPAVPGFCGASRCRSCCTCWRIQLLDRSFDRPCRRRRRKVLEKYC
jgi:hypothetical protein